MNHIHFFAAFIAVATACAEEPTELERYLLEAEQNNPGLQAARQQWQAAQQKARAAGALPDPKFGYTHFFDEVETRTGPQEQKFGLSQAFPGFGKRSLRRKVAGAGADAIFEALQGKRRALRYRVTRAYYEYWYLGRAIRTTGDNVAFLKHLESVAQARYKAGGPLSGVTKAQVELGKIEDRLRSLQDMREPLAAQLNAALSRPHSTAVTMPERPAFSPAFTHNGNEVLERAALVNPELREWEARARQAERKAALARRNNWPDLMVGVEAIRTGDAAIPNQADSGKDPVMAMIGFNIPLWQGRNRAEQKEAEALRDAARSTRDDRARLLEADLKMALYRHRDAERKITLYKDTLVPQAKQSLQVTEEGYQAGKVDFLNLIDAQRLLLEFELSVDRARADREISHAEIERLSGATEGARP